MSYWFVCDLGGPWKESLRMDRKSLGKTSAPADIVRHVRADRASLESVTSELPPSVPTAKEEKK